MLENDGKNSGENVNFLRIYMDLGGTNCAERPFT